MSKDGIRNLIETFYTQQPIFISVVSFSYDCLFVSIMCNFPLCLGGGKNHSLPLNHTIADTAARINAITCFEIMLRTYARRTLFKSLEDSQPPLKEIAKLTGHTEIAILLEEKHLM